MLLGLRSWPYGLAGCLPWGPLSLGAAEMLLLDVTPLSPTLLGQGTPRQICSPSAPSALAQHPTLACAPSC